MANLGYARDALNRSYEARKAALKSRIGESYARGKEAYVNPYYGRNQWDSSAIQTGMADYAQRQARDEENAMSNLDSEKAMYEFQLALMEEAQRREDERARQEALQAGWMGDQLKIQEAMGGGGFGGAESQWNTHDQRWKEFQERPNSRVPGTFGTYTKAQGMGTQAGAAFLPGGWSPFGNFSWTPQQATVAPATESGMSGFNFGAMNAGGRYGAGAMHENNNRAGASFPYLYPFSGMPSTQQTRRNTGMGGMTGALRTGYPGINF